MNGRLQSWLARHAQTLIGSLGRLVQSPMASGMTMAVIAVALTFPLLLAVGLGNARGATANWTQAFQLSAYMDKKAAASRTLALEKQLRGRADVAGVQLITADEALTRFRSDSGFGEALDALGDNPLPDTLIVTPTLDASTPEAMETLRKAIASMPEVQNVQLDTEWVKRLHAVEDIAKRVVWVVAAILGTAVVLIVGNTIRLDVVNRRAEIEVMKLVGATDAFARRPFLYAGIWYGLGGGLVALAMQMLAVGTIAGPVDRLAKLYGSSFRLHGIGVGSALALLGTAAMLGWAGSWYTASRCIRQIEPN